MKIELYLVSAYEEFSEKNACRKHWNFQWRGRRRKEEGIHTCSRHWMYQWRSRRGGVNPYDGIHIRQESFGGLLQTPDGKLWKVDHEAYHWLNIAFGENV